jgi:ariadne-1
MSDEETEEASDYEYCEEVEEDMDDNMDDFDIDGLNSEPSKKMRKLERHVSYQIHPEVNILANQKLIIDEISEMLGITKHDAELLLRNYKWDKELACDAWWSEETNLRLKIGLPPTVVEVILL